MRIERFFVCAALVIVASSTGCDEAPPAPAPIPVVSTPMVPLPTGRLPPPAPERTGPLVTVVRAYSIPRTREVAMGDDEVAIGIELVDASDGTLAADLLVLDPEGNELPNRDLRWMNLESGAITDRFAWHAVGDPMPDGGRRMLLVTAVPEALEGVRLRIYGELTEVVSLTNLAEGAPGLPPPPMIRVLARARTTLPGWGAVVVARLETENFLPDETPEGFAFRDRPNDGRGATRYAIGAVVETDDADRPRTTPPTTRRRTFAVALDAQATGALWFDCGAETPCEVPPLSETMILPAETLAALAMQ